MGENHDLAPIQAAELRVEWEPRLQVASLRYFDASGDFAHALEGITGMNLPHTLGAARSAEGRWGSIILAWRSPTETLMISAAEALIETLQGATATLTDGCIVDQRGGALVLRAGGEAVADLIARLGGQRAGPASGESHRTRLADVAVLAVKVQPQETLLIVERSYAPHLMAAIRVNVADLTIPLFC